MIRRRRYGKLTMSPHQHLTRMAREHSQEVFRWILGDTEREGAEEQPASTQAQPSNNPGPAAAQPQLAPQIQVQQHQEPLQQDDSHHPSHHQTLSASHSLTRVPADQTRGEQQQQDGGVDQQQGDGAERTGDTTDEDRPQPLPIEQR
jgi:hypothetical protein